MAEISSDDCVLTAPWVPTGIKNGVLIFPCAVSIIPERAEEFLSK